MLYPKNSNEKLEKELFADPSSEYRGAPFWAWNCELDKEVLLEQIGYLKEMGFGGFHMHSRTGMATPYLSDSFMELVRHCVNKAKEENMLAWLYDEDRWPSGAAGGLVTKDKKYRAKHLLFTPFPYTSGGTAAGSLISASVGQRMENGKLIAKYDIILDESGYLSNYKVLREDEKGKNEWFAYLETAGESPWYNNQTYVNTLDKNAIDRFIEITYEAYLKHTGEDFGKTVPAIFTDEPQFSHKTTLGYANERKDIYLPWTDDLPDTYGTEFGMDLLKVLPELIWELPDGKISAARYNYHDHITTRFTKAFADNCGSWCRKHGLMLTGHMMEEATLKSQTAALGEAMRAYRAFDLPGIDILCDSREYNTAKQAQSAVHQFGYEGMLSELYGVTNWDFDFRGHKLQGDWQAALGVTVRVPHLSWVSMQGEAKRDYPASINYQSPWHKEYSLIEDHFARINTAMTRGKPLVRVGVIHPIESYWLHWGPAEQTASVREGLDSNHQKLTEWLIFSQIDFDFVSESLLPEQCKEGSFPLKVGKMEYDTIIIPGCLTLRDTTVDRLNKFVDQGGHLVILGIDPKFINARPIDTKRVLFENARRLPFDKNHIIDELMPSRILDIRRSDGQRTDRLITSIRKDKDSLWVFIANGKVPSSQDLIQSEDLTIRIDGHWNVEYFDTLSGEISRENTKKGKRSTIIKRKVYAHDSLLYKLTSNGGPDENYKEDLSTAGPASAEGKLSKVDIELSEPNVLLLDMAEYSFDSGKFNETDEILRIDNMFREKLGLPLRMDAVAQPWVIPPQPCEHTLKLRFYIYSQENISGTSLALENALKTNIVLNGEMVESILSGWYVDRSIQTVPLPDLLAGENVLELEIPFGQSADPEWCYLLGDFGVKVDGFNKILTSPVRELSFGDIVHQGLPFYGGNISYKLEIEGDGSDVHVCVPNYRGSLISVDLDKERIGTIVFDPYKITLPRLSPGKHEVVLTLFGNRVNTFGAVHNCDKNWRWHGPNSWRTTGDRWSYEYILKPTGILKSPSIYS